MSPGPSERKQRNGLLTRFFAAFAATGGDTTLKLATYLDETAEIPLPWLREGLRAFKDKPDQAFLPSVAEIRTETARAIRKHRREARGLSVPTMAEKLDVGGLLEFARVEAPMGVAQMHATHKDYKRLPSPPARVEAGERAGPAERADEFGAAMGSFEDRVVGQPGYLALAREIREAGREVPNDIHGLCMSYALASYRLGMQPNSSKFGLVDWQRYERHMTAHASNPNSDTTWWDEVREGWKETAMENDRRGRSLTHRSVA